VVQRDGVGFRGCWVDISLRRVSLQKLLFVTSALDLDLFCGFFLWSCILNFCWWGLGTLAGLVLGGDGSCDCWRMSSWGSSGGASRCSSSNRAGSGGDGKRSGNKIGVAAVVTGAWVKVVVVVVVELSVA
jgi:hypothetical protein